MIRLVEHFEPKQAHLREHAAFVGNAGRQDPVERTDAIGGHQQKPVAKIVNIADLASMHGPAIQNGLQERCFHAEKYTEMGADRLGAKRGAAGPRIVADHCPQV